jgi:hypothetical protein
MPALATAAAIFSDLCVEYRLREGRIALVATDAQRGLRCELIAQTVGGDIHPDGPTEAPVGTLQ